MICAHLFRCCLSQQIQAVQHQSIPQQQHLQSAQQLQQTLAHQPPLMGYQSMQPAVGQVRKSVFPALPPP
eukprot:6214707-Pleurochrysis_carterae.AAC.1